MAQTAYGPRIFEVIGSYAPFVHGVAGGSGTSTVVTVPQFSAVTSVFVSGATGTTVAYCDTISGNTFTVTTNNNDLFSYLAFGKAKI